MIINPTLVILAAGMGSRYGGLKQLDGLGPNQETIIDYSLYDAIHAGFKKVVFIIREDFASEFEKNVSQKFQDKIEVVHVFQSLDTREEDLPCPVDRVKPWGTGHALLVANEVVSEPFAVINADDYYGQTAFDQAHGFLSGLVDFRLAGMVGYSLENTLSDHGHVNRGVCRLDDNDFLEQVVERERIFRKEDSIVYGSADSDLSALTSDAVVSMNFWLFHPGIFDDLKQAFRDFLMESRQVDKSEFYIPKFVDDAIQQGEMQVLVMPSDDHWHGVTYQEDKSVVQAALNHLHNQNKYPSPLY